MVQGGVPLDQLRGPSVTDGEVLVLTSVTVDVSGRLISHDSVGLLDGIALGVGGVGAAIGNMGVHAVSQPARRPGEHAARPSQA